MGDYTHIAHIYHCNKSERRDSGLEWGTTTAGRTYHSLQHTTQLASCRHEPRKHTHTHTLSQGGLESILSHQHILGWRYCNSAYNRSIYTDRELSTHLYYHIIYIERGLQRPFHTFFPSSNSLSESFKNTDRIVVVSDSVVSMVWLRLWLSISEVYNVAFCWICSGFYFN